MPKVKRAFTAAIPLDVEKAFDSVWHDGLRYKMYAAGLPVQTTRILSSFLTDKDGSRGDGGMHPPPTGLPKKNFK